jgi:hypothetical protein
MSEHQFNEQQHGSLQQALDALFQQNQHLQSQIQALTNRPPADVDDLKTPGHQLKPKQPPEFNGRKTKGTLSAHEWLFVVEEYLLIICGGVVRDAQAVSYAGTLLTEYAASWWVTYRPLHQLITWAEFKNALTQEFQDLNEARTARDSLLQLKQGGRGVQLYASEFRATIRKLPNMDMGDQIYFFMNGLRSNTVRIQVSLRSPTTLEEAIQAAHTADQLIISSGYDSDTPRNSMTPLPPAPMIPQPQQFTTPMEIGAVGQPQRQRPRPPLSPEERTLLSQNNGCFYCRVMNAGHLAAQCPLNVRARNRNFGRGQ